jgi:hypothetical protein
LAHRTRTGDLSRCDAAREYDLVADRILDPHDQRTGFGSCHLVMSLRVLADEHTFVVRDDEVHRDQGRAPRRRSSRSH